MSFTVSVPTRSTASPRQSRGPGRVENVGGFSLHEEIPPRIAGFNMYPKMPESGVEDLEANSDSIILHHP